MTYVWFLLGLYLLVGIVLAAVAAYKNWPDDGLWWKASLVVLLWLPLLVSLMWDVRKEKKLGTKFRAQVNPIRDLRLVFKWMTAIPGMKVYRYDLTADGKPFVIVDLLPTEVLLAIMRTLREFDKGTKYKTVIFTYPPLGFTFSSETCVTIVWPSAAALAAFVEFLNLKRDAKQEVLGDAKDVNTIYGKRIESTRDVEDAR